MLKVIKINPTLRLTPFDLNLKQTIEQYQLEKKLFFINTNETSVKNHLSDISEDTIEKSKKIFDKLLLNASEGKYIFHSISCLSNNNWNSIGYIFLANPKLKSVTNENGTPINAWAISYLLAKNFRQDGIMKLALNSFLEHIENKQNIKRVIGVVKTNNPDSYNLLKSLKFKQIIKDKGSDRVVYGRVK